VAVTGDAISDENARRLAERLRRDQPLITEADVEEYTRVHYPHHIAEDYVPGRRGRPVAIPGDAYVATLSHERFHDWFGTECDATCPHRRYLPSASIARRPWWKRLLGWLS
jgi:hypothetical protein